MITGRESFFLATCLFEGLFFGLYSGIYAIYLRCSSNKSRSTIIIFYALFVLYFLSAITLVSDVVALSIISGVRKLSIQDQINSEFLLFRISIVQSTASGCCDFIAQSILIYRCWIVWGQNIYVVIFPSFLVIVYMATWFGSDAAITFDSKGQSSNAPWGIPVTLTSFGASMVVNTLVTGLIVFKILKVFLEINKATSVELTLSSLSSTGGGSKLRHILFVIIESGMALFVIQLIHILYIGLGVATPDAPQPPALNFITAINQMFNGITPTIILVRVSMKLSFDDNASFRKTTESLLDHAPTSDPNVLLRIETISSNMEPQGRSEDTC